MIFQRIVETVFTESRKVGEGFWIGKYYLPIEYSPVKQLSQYCDAITFLSVNNLIWSSMLKEVKLFTPMLVSISPVDLLRQLDPCALLTTFYYFGKPTARIPLLSLFPFLAFSAYNIVLVLKTCNCVGIIFLPRQNNCIKKAEGIKIIIRCIVSSKSIGIISIHSEFVCTIVVPFEKLISIIAPL
ncbi:hypothetical protein WUBG_00196 [Wuchereria bancrofti]|uniref:Uncharacterized protein n=1 Tax=Wuchereria bancrofti TaxID=6293 RepID=J9F1W9_WUCBA|nr:hypothetical protein WUBG_00196 [Wuchereria bancrofti]